MKIEVKRTGGVAGLRQPPLTVDSAALSAADARKLHDLIAAADFFNLPAKGAQAPRGADRMQYSVTVDADDKTHHVQISEDQMPQSLRTLVDWLPDITA